MREVSGGNPALSGEHSGRGGPHSWAPGRGGLPGSRRGRIEIHPRPSPFVSTPRRLSAPVPPRTPPMPVRCLLLMSLLVLGACRSAPATLSLALSEERPLHAAGQTG